MATLSINYDGSAVSLTITNLESKANSNTVFWQSAAIDNTSAGTPSASISDNALDCLVQAKIVVGSGTLANDKAVYVYVYGSADGTTYPDTVTGSEGTFTLAGASGGIHQLRLLGTILVPTNSTTYISEPFSVAGAFAGSMPRKWGVAIQNYTGVALSTGNVVLYQAIKQTVT